MQTQSLDELISRLERLSADSPWAHRASGLRRSLVRAQEAARAGHPYPPAHLSALLQQAYQILEAAAREIPDRHPQAAATSAGKTSPALPNKE